VLAFLVRAPQSVCGRLQVFGPSVLLLQHCCSALVCRRLGKRSASDSTKSRHSAPSRQPTTEEGLDALSVPLPAAGNPGGAVRARMGKTAVFSVPSHLVRATLGIANVFDIMLSIRSRQPSTAEVRRQSPQTGAWS
jgi:hypothetical protein